MSRKRRKERHLRKKGIIIGILQKYLGDKEKLDEVLGRVKEMGYEAIQYIIPDYVTPEEYKALLDKHGLKYLCVGAKFQAMSGESPGNPGCDKAV